MITAAVCPCNFATDFGNDCAANGSFACALSASQLAWESVHGFNIWRNTGQPTTEHATVRCEWIILHTFQQRHILRSLHNRPGRADTEYFNYRSSRNRRWRAPEPGFLTLSENPISSRHPC